MAENDGQERSFEPTAKRRADARRKGQVPRSREFATTALLAAAAAGLVLCGGHMVEAMRACMVDMLSLDRAALSDAGDMTGYLAVHLAQAFMALAPFFALMFVVALAAPVAVGGWIFSTEAMSFQFNRLDPVKGLVRIFGVHGWVELAKALAKFVLILGVAVWVMWRQTGPLLGLGRMALEPALADALRIGALVCGAVAATTILVALIDVPFQLWDHGRQLRMTREEMREENKETEGRPEVRARIRQIQQEHARRRMMEQVPKADVIVTNPTHYAVALRYDAARMDAPVVVAKGADLIAQRIREIGERHRVPVLSAPLLARALYHTAKLDQQIPAGLYRAVAQVLAYVFQVRALRPGQAAPGMPVDLPIPEEFRYDH
ncbi:MAG: flagellar biosynthesis protein FlhB [Gammaproteobacteria bacterium]